MQATITYLLTEQAQRAQMAATGQPVARKQVRTVEVTVEDMPYCTVAEDGSLSLSLPMGNRWYEGLAWLDPSPRQDILTVDIDIFAAIRAREVEIVEAARAKQAKESAEQATERQAYLALDPIWAAALDAMSAPYDIWNQRVNDHVRVGDISRNNARPLINFALDRYDARRQAAKNEADTAKAAAELAKTDAITAFVAASGDALLIAQHADGMLCRKTIIAFMAAAAFDAAGLPEICPDSTVCDDRDCPCCTAIVNCIPPTVYARWKALGLPDDTIVVFHRVRNCMRDEDGYPEDNEPAGPVEYHADVTITSGPFQFTRRIKL